jgi:hypothetical protein
MPQKIGMEQHGQLQQLYLRLYKVTVALEQEHQLCLLEEQALIERTLMNILLLEQQR